MKRFFYYLSVIALSMQGSFARAQDTSLPQLQAPDFHSNDSKFFSPAPVRNEAHMRNFLLPQLISVVLPGFDQWWEGQIPTASVYSAAAVGGYLLSGTTAKYETTGDSDVDDRNNNARRFALGTQIALDSGFQSAYQSFRTAVRTQQAQGRFLFLKHEETTDELLTDPLAFSEITKPTTFAPLLVILGAGILDAGYERGGRSHFTGPDAFYASSYSYLAGASEEPAFRGWLMPVAYHYMDNYFWSNTATATIFAAAHLSQVSIPWPQFALGWYLGYLTQRNEWTLRQSIFIHTWWDVIAFTTQYYRESRSHLTMRQPAAITPLLNASF